MHRLLLGLALLLTSLTVNAKIADAATIYRAPDLSNGRPLSQLRLLPNGAGVVGVAGNEIFQWRLGQERTVIGSLPTLLGGYVVNPVAISGDGEAIFGNLQYPVDPGREPDELWRLAPHQGFRWTAANGLERFTMGRPNSGIAPIAASHDGSTFVGVMGYQEQPYSPLHTYTMRWSNGAFEQLALPNYSPYPDLVAESWFLISGDGNRIVGSKYANNNVSGVFQWTRDGGVQDWTPAGASNPAVLALSHDGNVFFGTATFATGGRRAFRWTASNGMQMLDEFDLSGQASIVTTDGSMVLGFSSHIDESKATGATIRKAILWDKDHGSRRISAVLDDAGIAWRHLDWFNPDDASQLSADGSALFGSTTALNSLGQLESTSWIIKLAVPEPSSIAATCLFAPIFAIQRRMPRRS
ncbi:hypothetical protein [Lacipirellula parvula]|uniref:Uncharacterized protein n=1 Tax=Lacipirellula parvula TaxID=2650471 RepID=A0A5K7XK13_9BACT|nr:hypothetical protein [Lacipirellula parvula]BBO36492.1 hypothetical protein PLANPX_6104 [Lacipirellula parvula]